MFCRVILLDKRQSKKKSILISKLCRVPAEGHTAKSLSCARSRHTANDQALPCARHGKVKFKFYKGPWMGKRTK